MINKQPLFFLSVILVMIVPTITSTIMTSASAQTTTTSSSSPTDLRNRTYGPTTQQNSTTTQQNSTTTQTNITSSINNTAVEGIQSLRELLNMLEPEIKRYELSGVFNDAVMSFVHIQGNVSALEEWTTNITDEAVQQVIQARANSTASETALESSRAELEAARAEIASLTSAAEEEEEEEGDAETAAEDENGGNGNGGGEDTEPEPEPTPEPEPAATPEPEPQSNALILEELVRNSNSEGSSGTFGNNDNSGNSNGPRLDPEGDGGPGDIDG